MTETEPSILVIDDEIPIRRLLRTALTGHGYRITEAATGKDGLDQAAMQRPDLIILDLGLPDLDGVEVVRQLREWTTLPIIILTVRGQEESKVSAFDAGADDYLTKPFGIEELLARIRVILRHIHYFVQKDEQPIFIVDDWKVDLSKRRVFIGETEVRLTPIEYQLLVILIRNAGKVVTHSQLLKEVWGSAYANQTPYLHIYMHRLRLKLENDPAHPQHLILEPGIGYRFSGE
jgi:two-component system KDP operon response regulator KdpE